MDSLTRGWSGLRRIIGAVSLFAGMWAIWTIMQFQIAGRELIGFDWYRFALGFVGPIGLWLLLTFVSKLGMVFDIRRVSLSGVALVWFFLFTYVMIFIPTVTGQPPPPSASPSPTIPIGPIHLDPVDILALWYPLIDFYDATFPWLGPKIFDR